MRNQVSPRVHSRFQAISRIGRGATGVVYEAVDQRTGQPIALKELTVVSAQSIARFKAEFRALRGCHHPNLVGLKELIEDEGRWTIVMELVPGVDLLAYVQGAASNDNQPFDEARLRAALLGTARGLTALHRFGFLHRDLKPSNVRVTPEGRAVLLDFGLVTQIDPSEQSTRISVLGTIAYMAPEQAASTNISPAADWYAFGVCLFQALTGRLPIEGASVYDVLHAKQSEDAPRASSVAPGIPADLDALCARLLARDPLQRAGAREVFATLGAPREGGDEAGPGGPTPTPFAGREAELLQLERALARTDEGALRLVLIEGESGVGKSELATEFVRRARARHPDLLALRGRCYETEQIAYKAIDGCIDELARFLGHLPEHAAAMLLPVRAGLLAQLFPALQGVRALARAPLAEPSADPTARRLEAFAALAALLHRLAQEQPVMLVIDDLQWADSESFRLLGALFESPEPPPILIVATIRPPEELDAEAQAGLALLQRKQRLETVPVLGLPPQEAAALARALLGPSAGEAYCQLIATESRGHPLFLSELVQFARSHDLATRGSITLEAALRARIRRLAPSARALLEVASLAGRPYGSQVFARALKVRDVEDAARTLLAEKLLRVRKNQELGVYHDGIRRAAVALIAKSRVAGLHRQIAAALASEPDATVYAFEEAQHWDLAGDPDRALDAYACAVEVALETLAFNRAAELCERALRLAGEERSQRVDRLYVTRAHALACAGRSAEAAACYERAVGRAHGQHQLELRARHVEQLLVSGALEQGLAQMRGVLAEVGVRLPESNLAILVRIALDRMWLAVRGRRFDDARALQPGDQDKFFKANVLGTFSAAISPIHPLAMTLLVLHAARLAYRLPVPQILVQLFTALGWLRSLSGEMRAAQAMFDRANKLAHRVDSDVVESTALLAEGSAALLRWDAAKCARLLERAHHVLQTRCPDQPWMLRNVRYHVGNAWYALGRHRELADASERWIREARERSDRLTVALLIGMGHGFVRHLMRDDPEAALAELDEAMRDVPSAPYSFVHAGAMFARTLILLYQGGPAAYAWLEAETSGKTPLLLRSPSLQKRIALLRAEAALHAYASASATERPRLLARVARDLQLLMRDRLGLALVHGQLLLAQLHALEGRMDKALAAARAARTTAMPGESNTNDQIGAYLTALLETGQRGDPRCQETLAQGRAAGWRRPLAFVQMLIPIVDVLWPAGPTSPPEGPALLLERFEVVRSLGDGGFGSVVEAREVHTGRTLALKELVSKHPRSLERFKQEFRQLRDLHHANLIQLEALLEHEGTWYMAMELLVGESLVQYCRPAGRLDRGRLSRAFVGLCDGLAALHEAGFAHRDVSPDNVLVSEGGRAVLLDFGLIGRLGDAQDADAVGTFAYGAPEQLAGCPPSSAADVYALGACLHEALTGALPGGPEPSAAPPTPLVDADCQDLLELAREMLEHEPRARPALAIVRARIQGSAGLGVLPRHDVHPAAFTGRERELAQLLAAFERSADGLQVVLIEGESGLGKSALMAELLREREAHIPNLLALRSRCYESEQLALKAFDGAVDRLARALRGYPTPTMEALLPRRAALLAQLFPVLGSVPAIAGATKRGLPADLGARRRAAAACFVELLAKLTRSAELLIAIDDLQWADGESLRLLRGLVAQRETLPFLIVATVRPAAELAPELAPELAALRACEGVESIALRGLDTAAAGRLVAALSREAPTAAWVAQVVSETKGHPLFLRELVEHAREGGALGAAPTLDEALSRRIASFDESARRLLTLVALAGKPYGAHVFARALKDTPGLREAVVALLGRGLLRASGSDALAVDHDRIARVALARVPPEEARALARDLVGALELEPGVEASDRARLWDAAGEGARAASAYVEAGDRALVALQFVGAAQHYQRALDLSHGADGAWRRSVLARCGDALARAGHCAEAARAYQRAAEGAEGELAARLRTRAAEQAIQGGQAAWGLSTTGALLEALDIGVPLGRPRAALARIAYHRLTLSLRRRRAGRAVKPVSERMRMQLDAAWTLAQPLSWLDSAAGGLLGVHHLRIALASGEPAHTARALAAEAFAYAVQGTHARRRASLIARARELAAALRDPALEVEVDYREGVAASYGWDLTVAHELLMRALQQATERCPDQPWLTTNIRLALGNVLYNRGEHAQLARLMDTWRAEARDRGDQLAQTALYGVGFGFVADLMANDSDGVLARIAEERARWPSQQFSFLHFGMFVASTEALLAAGDGHAWRWFERERPRLERAVLLRFGTARAVYLSREATAALAAYRDASGSEAQALLDTARARVGALASVSGARAGLLAPYLRAQLDALVGARGRALDAAEQVSVAAEQCGDLLTAHRARYLAAALEGGHGGEAACVALEEHYAQQGWKRPEQVLTTLCPLLEQLRG